MDILKGKNTNMSPVKNVKSKKKFIIPAVILGVVMIAAIVMSQFDMPGGVPAGVPVSAGTTERMDITEELSVKGTVQGEKYAELHAVGGYQITQVLVSEGDVVAKDQLLMVLDPGSADMPESKAATEAARLEYEAAKQLYEAGGLSRVDYLKAKGAYENASNTSASPGTRIKSPFSGTVTRVNGVVGSVIESGKPAVVVEDLEKLQMRVAISEYDISNIRVGQKVVISAEVIGDSRLAGEVTHISPTGELKSNASSEMVIPVTISIDRADSNLISGVTAKARIIIAEAANALTVPVDSILQDPETGENFVIVIEDGITRKQPVDLGVEGDFYVQVQNKELKEGTQVILSPELDMKDGTQVYVTPEI